MKVIKCLSENIEETLDAADTNIMKAIQYKDEFPVAAKAFYNQSVVLMDSIKGQHDAVVSLIDAYKKEKGEPPAPMAAIYNYLHERQIRKAAEVKNLQEMYLK